MSEKVLVADDDGAVRRSLERALRFEGYEVLLAEDGADAIDAVSRHAPDVVVLDIMMPHVDGLAAARRLRARGVSTPILMLTARHEISDRVAGLDAGADDYLSKPFALEELLARIRALLRRSAPANGLTELALGDLTLNLETRQVYRGETLIDLTKTEFDLLDLLLTNAGVVLSRSRVYEEVWGFDFGPSSNSLDVYIGYLRRKTEADNRPRLIHTVRGVGYVAREQP